MAAAEYRRAKQDLRCSGGLSIDRNASMAIYASPPYTFTFLFTDIEGCTALLNRLGEDGDAQVLADHHRVIHSGLADYGGREMGTAGDGFFAVFPVPRAALAAVFKSRRRRQTIPGRLRSSSRSGGHGMRVRRRRGQRASWASTSIAPPVSGPWPTAARSSCPSRRRRSCGGPLPIGVSLRELGLHRLKDLGQPEHLFQVEAPGLEPDFPPLRSLDNPALQNNLPVQLSTFIGRTSELSEFRNLVESARLVTLTGAGAGGAGGAGKTRLALQVAAQLLDGSGDGVLFGELAAVTDGAAVAPAVAEALGPSLAVSVSEMRTGAGRMLWGTNSAGKRRSSSRSPAPALTPSADPPRQVRLPCRAVRDCCAASNRCSRSGTGCALTIPPLAGDPPFVHQVTWSRR